MPWEPTDEEVRRYNELAPKHEGATVYEFLRAAWAVSPGPRRTKEARTVAGLLRSGHPARSDLREWCASLADRLDALAGEPAEPEPDPRGAVVTAARALVDDAEDEEDPEMEGRMTGFYSGDSDRLVALRDALREVKP